jgi:hypothetical protein
VHCDCGIGRLSVVAVPQCSVSVVFGGTPRLDLPTRHHSWSCSNASGLVGAMAYLEHLLIRAIATWSPLPGEHCCRAKVGTSDERRHDALPPRNVVPPSMLFATLAHSVELQLADGKWDGLGTKHPITAQRS